MTGQAKKVHEHSSNPGRDQRRGTYESPADVMRQASEEAVKKIEQLFEKASGNTNKKK